MVCSRHFEGVPTAENLYLTLELGYEKPIKKARRRSERKPLQPEKDEIPMNIGDGYVGSCDNFVISSDHDCVGMDGDKNMPCLL